MNTVTGLGTVLFFGLAPFLVSGLRPILLPGAVLSLLACLRASLVNLTAPVGTACRLAAAISTHAAAHAATHSSSGVSHGGG